MVNYEFEVNHLGGWAVFQQTAPSSFILDAPSKLLRSGRFAKNIDIITGWNENDGSIFVEKNITTSADVAAAASEGTMNGAKLTNAALQEMLALYPLSSFEDDPSENFSAQYFRAAQIGRDIMFTCPSLFMVEAMANHSMGNTTNQLYVLNETLFKPEWKRLHSQYLGVGHGSDVPFAYNDASAIPNTTPSEVQLAEEMSGSWAGFAYTDVPTMSRGGFNTTLQDWPEGYAKGDDESAFSVRVIGGPHDGPASISSDGTGGVLDKEDVVRRCRFWTSKEVTAQLQV